MDSLAILCILIGVLIIVVRAPLIFAPRATLRFFDRLISSDVGIRGIGLVVAPFAVALVVFAGGEGLAAEILQGLGWLFAAAALWLLFVPDSYRRLARGVLDYVESSVDMAIVRILGVVAVTIGVTLIYVGLYVV